MHEINIEGFPKSETILTTSKSTILSSPHNELFNPQRRFITSVCEQLDITRKKFKRLLKEQSFRNELEEQLIDLN